MEQDKGAAGLSDMNNPFSDDLRAAAAASAVARGDRNPFDSPPSVEQSKLLTDRRGGFPE